MRKFLVVSFSALAVVLGARQNAEAASITFTGGPAGLTFTLSGTLLTPAEDLNPADGLNDTYALTLTMVSSTYANASSGIDYLESIGIDIGGTLDATADDGFTPTPQVWQFNANVGVNGSGMCNGSVDGSVCLQDTSTANTNLALATAGTYEWKFKVDLGADGFSTPMILQFGRSTIEDNDQFKKIDVQTLTGDGLPNEAVLLDVVSTPEPSSMLLLGAGLAGLVAYRRRLNRR